MVTKMNLRFFARTAPLAMMLAAALMAAPPKKWKLSHTPDGQPDLQGMWSNATITPLERPKELAEKEFFTEQEAADYEKKFVRDANRDQRGTDAASDLNGAYNELWFDRGTKVVPTLRTSLVVDPRDGRVPPLTAEPRKAAADRQKIAQRPPEGPEDFPLLVRCLLWPTAGPPMLPSAYNKQLPDSAESWIRGDSSRDGPRYSHHPAGRASSYPEKYPSVARRSARSSGGKHTHSRHNQFHGQDALQQLR
jgi:hypothetical protein